jgi:hypothetical protein
VIGHRKILAMLLALAAFSACTLQKRHYRPGFYLGARGVEYASGNDSKPACEEIPARRAACRQPQARLKALATIDSGRCLVAHAQGRAAVTALALKKLAVSEPLLRKKHKALYESVLPNQVARAAFRMMLISFGLLGIAFLLSVTSPELVYVTFIILVATLVYALVSLISAVNARKDKIANSPAWLRLALLALILSILIICLSALLIILLL